MKEVDGWGGGVSRYFKSCAKLGLAASTVEETAGFVKVVFWRKPIAAIGGNGGNRGGNGGNVGGDGVNAMALVLSVLRENPQLTAHAVSEKTGMSLRTVERTLADLKKSGTLVRKGGTCRYWEILAYDNWVWTRLSSFVGRSWWFEGVGRSWWFEGVGRSWWFSENH